MVVEERQRSMLDRLRALGVLNRVVVADARSYLRSLPTGCVHLAVTSPPYFGHREYKTAPQVWALTSEQEACPHEVWGQRLLKHRGAAGRTATVGNTKRGLRPYEADKGQFCLACSAWRGSLGQEQSVREYVDHLLAITAEVRRVLRDDGIFWLNISDGFSAGGWECRRPNRIGQGAPSATQRRARPLLDDDDPPDGSLFLVPERLALALQRQGWLVRQRILAFKTSPMPESVAGWRWEPHVLRHKGNDHHIYEAALQEEIVRTGGDRVLASANVRHRPQYLCWDIWRDERCPGCATCEPNDGLVLRRAAGRPTTAVEHIWLLSKQGHAYYYDTGAIRVPHKPDSHNPDGRAGRQQYVGGSKAAGYHEAGGDGSGMVAARGWGEGGRNQWSWWPPEPYDLPDANAWLWSPEPDGEEHWATFPKHVPYRAIMLGTPPHVCSACGAPFARVLRGNDLPLPGRGSGNKVRLLADGATRGRTNTHLGSSVPWQPHVDPTVGWRATCTCNAERAAAIVLDPFLGSGTTAGVALALGRSFLGCDLNRSYAETIAPRRIARIAGWRANEVGISAVPSSRPAPRSVDGYGQLSLLEGVPAPS